MTLEVRQTIYKHDMGYYRIAVEELLKRDYTLEEDTKDKTVFVKKKKTVYE